MALSITPSPVSLLIGGQQREVVGCTLITLLHSVSEAESGMQ
jgi:hypothetical protein